jgi:hypothetical protein
MHPQGEREKERGREREREIISIKTIAEVQHMMRT